ncbi:MAG: hypothetical protein ACON3Z_19935 [Bradymonadia bacterium]
MNKPSFDHFGAPKQIEHAVDFTLRVSLALPDTIRRRRALRAQAYVH